MNQWLQYHAGVVHPDDGDDVLDREAESQRGDGHASDDHDSGDFLQIGILVFVIGNKAGKINMNVPRNFKTLK